MLGPVRRPRALVPMALVSDIPLRLDRLRWSGWHWRIVFALGAAWVLDGLEVTVVGSLGAAFMRSDTLGLTAAQVAATGSLYVGGAIVGALIFGRTADRLGRKRLFLVTLGVYLGGTLASALAFGFYSFALARVVTGFGIGGEYGAINAAIDELIPARLRGRVNLSINGSFWAGALIGAVLALVLLDPRWIGPHLGWRLAFGVGVLLAVALLVVRRHVPESPRWLLAHGQARRAEEIVRAAEACAGSPTDRAPIVPVRIVEGTPTLGQVTRIILGRYRLRAAVALALMVAQAFFYNAIFFTHALVLTRFEGVAGDRVPLYTFPYAVGNLIGPLVLGPLFDRLGRRRMLGLSYVFSGLALVGTAVLFAFGPRSAALLSLTLSVAFFIGSAAASGAYLTVSEVFPLYARGLAIALFYAVGTGAGGFAGPLVFGALLGTGLRGAVAGGYVLAAVLMVGAGLFAWRCAVPAERRALEDISPDDGAALDPSFTGPV